MTEKCWLLVESRDGRHFFSKLHGHLPSSIDQAVKKSDPAIVECRELSEHDKRLSLDVLRGVWFSGHPGVAR